MLRIALVEDDQREADRLSEYLEKYFKEIDQEGHYSLSVFNNPIPFLSQYKANYDLLLMDIDLPNMNGLQASAQIREKDEGVTIVFVTNLSQYAVKGYSVNALDYIVKPVAYMNFSTMMNKVMRIKEKNASKVIQLSTSNGYYIINISDIMYVTLDSHKLIYKTQKEEISVWGTIKNAEEQLPKTQFVKCNSGYIINLHFVKKVQDDTVFMRDGASFVISRLKKKAFLTALAEYCSA